MGIGKAPLIGAADTDVTPVKTKWSKNPHLIIKHHVPTTTNIVLIESNLTFLGTLGE